MKRAAVLLSAMLLASACGVIGGDDDSGGAGLVTSSLEGLPQLSSDEPYDILIVDLASITELVGGDDIFSALVPRSRSEGGLGINVVPPQLLQRAFDPEAFEAEAGFRLDEIERSAEVSSGVDAATVLTGPSGWGGAAQPHVDGVRTIGVGDDFGIDLESSRVLDQIGRPLRVAEADGRLLATLSTPVAQSWVDGSGARYSDLDVVSDMAAELDRFDVLSAALFVGSNFSARLPQPEFGESFDDLEQRLEDEGLSTYVSQPFDALGFGNAIRDGQTIDVVTYHFLSEDSAEAALASIEQAWTETVLLASREPISSLTEFDSIERNGSVVTVVAIVPDDRVSAAISMFFAGEAPFAYG